MTPSKRYLTPCSTASICFDCQRACGGCCWSEINPKTDHPRFCPVPGWTAKKVPIYVGNNRKSEWEFTFYVTGCPLFLPDPPRPKSEGEATEDQLKVMMEHWRNEE